MCTYYHSISLIVRLLRRFLAGVLFSAFGALFPALVITWLLSNLRTGSSVPSVLILYCLGIALSIIIIRQRTKLAIVSRRQRQLLYSDPVPGLTGLWTISSRCPRPPESARLPSCKALAIDGVLYLLAAVLIIWAIPLLVIYWTVNPLQYKRAVKIGTFFISAGIGIVYYLRNRHLFPSAADKITFFSSIVLGPAALVELFL